MEGQRMTWFKYPTLSISSRFQIFGIWFSDKSFIYLAGLQIHFKSLHTIDSLVQSLVDLVEVIQASRARLFKEYKEVQREKAVDPDIELVCDDSNIFKWTALIKTGEICLDILKNAWSPAWTLQSVCRAIIALMAHPEPDSPLNCDSGNLLRSGDLRGYRSMARMYTRLAAMPKKG
ncbi:hypothetical protein Taro_033389 [Colocasia esculenta]|uniref:UBC core domain-containing protein n=1 Tax=Colocasia esculenta TaxID=4460 RepID=A0A843W8W5_COLES|nr:hypothetical protein [Colocasia esculenta]